MPRSPILTAVERSMNIPIYSHGCRFQAELFTPTTMANGAAVVVAHGSDGMIEPWASMIREYATDLAARGFAALVPHYFDKTNGFSQTPASLTAWVEAVADTVTSAKTLPGVTTPQVGLLGFSLGGHICLRLRSAAQA